MSHFLSILIAFVLLTVTGCSKYEINSVEKVCETLTDNNFLVKKAPFWALIPSVSYNGEAVRDDFVRTINEPLMLKAQDRAPRMVWRVGSDLHMLNLSTLFVVEPNRIISEWRNGIERGKSYKFIDADDKCFWGTVTIYFDNVVIHSEDVAGAAGVVSSDDVTTIATDRKERLKGNLH